MSFLGFLNIFGKRRPVEFDTTVQVGIQDITVTGLLVDGETGRELLSAPGHKDEEGARRTILRAVRKGEWE